jgi:hypothetical protein
MKQALRFLLAMAMLLTSFNERSLAARSQVPAVPSQGIGAKMTSTAEACLGKKMWTGYGLSTGYLGCAAAVSNVTKKAGFAAGHSAAVSQLRNQLLASKCCREFVIRSGPKEDLSDSKLNAVAQPGDIVLAFAKPPESNWNGGGSAHCGILSAPTEICTNDWNDGIWKKLNIHLMFDAYPYLRIIRIEKFPGSVN